MAGLPTEPLPTTARSPIPFGQGYTLAMERLRIQSACFVGGLLGDWSLETTASRTGAGSTRGAMNRTLRCICMFKNFGENQRFPLNGRDVLDQAKA